MIEISLCPMDVDSYDFNYINEKNSIYFLDCRITELIDFLEYDLELSQNIINKYKIDSSVCSLGSMKSILIDMEEFDIDEFGFKLDEIGSGIHDLYLGEAITEFNKKINDLKESRVCIIDEFYIHTEFKNKKIGSKALSDFLYVLKHVYYVDYVFLYPYPIFYEKSSNVDVLRNSLYRFYEKFGFSEMPIDIKYEDNPFYYLKLS